jgi:hypothetical protein
MVAYNITYKGTSYTLKQNLMSIFAFEDVTGRLFELKTTYDLFVNMYCLFIGNNHIIDSADFLAYVDEHPSFMNEFYAGIVSTPEGAESPDKKK